MSRLGSWFGRFRGGHAHAAAASSPASFDWSVSKDENHDIHTLLNQGAYEQAETLLLRLYDADPTSQRVIKLLADVAERRKHWKDALYWWSKVSTDRDNRWQVNLPRARILARQGHADQARARFAQVLEKAHGNAAIVMFASHVLPELDHEGQARFALSMRSMLQDIETRTGESTDSLVARANIARCEGRLEEVYVCMRRAHLLRPQEPYLRSLALEAGERAGIVSDLSSL